MNIFILDTNIKTCARYHADQHVIKMILEGTQMLCTVLSQNGIEAPYKSTHLKHPCTLWAGKSLSNWLWLQKLTLQLNQEFQYRFGRETDHRSAEVAKRLPAPPLQDLGLTEFAQAMPEKFRIAGNPVQAYRNFYIFEKSRFAKWTRRRPPKWFTAGIKEIAYGHSNQRGK